ncbi:MAG TPA: YceI family protein [Novimethylophilus sp.]|jgi:polyisoprenoid-binding protein YceI|uniref:YceI family protein n=1 Tax=Novimethylophilus sp. TaxID=2137426 RepID=UPI002F3FAD4E
MKHNIPAVLLGSLALASLAQAAEFTSIQADKSTLGFVYTQMGVPVDGHFKKFAALLSFDPAKPASARAVFDLDLASIDAGSQEANDEVAGKAWFNTKAFPRAKFESTGVKALGGNRYEVSGKMSIKGRTQTVSAPFTFNPQGNVAVVDGAFVLKRADFAIGEGTWADFGTVANEIQIKFHFLANAGK